MDQTLVSKDLRVNDLGSAKVTYAVLDCLECVMRYLIKTFLSQPHKRSLGKHWEHSRAVSLNSFLNMKTWRFTNLLLSIFVLPKFTFSQDCDTQRDARRIWADVRPLDDCDIFKKELTLRVDQMIQNPMCLVKMALEVDGKRWTFENPGPNRTVRNMIKDKCRKTSFTILTKDKFGKKRTKTFELDPSKCIEDMIKAAKVPFSTFGENKIRVDVTSGFAQKPYMQECLKRVEVLELQENTRPITKYKQKGMTMNLDRSKGQFLMLMYQLKNSSEYITKSLSVPRTGKIYIFFFSFL